MVVMSSLKRSEKRVLRKLSRLSRLCTYCAMLFTYGGRGQCQRGGWWPACTMRHGRTAWRKSLSQWTFWYFIGAPGAQAASGLQNASDNTEWLPWRLEVTRVSSSWPLLRGSFHAPDRTWSLAVRPSVRRHPHPHPQQPTSWKTERGRVPRTTQVVLVHDTGHTKEPFYNAVRIESLLFLKLQ